MKLIHLILNLKNHVANISWEQSNIRIDNLHLRLSRTVASLLVLLDGFVAFDTIDALGTTYFTMQMTLQKAVNSQYCNSVYECLIRNCSEIFLEK